MIKINIGITNEHVAVQCTGHANYNVCGEDIVCSAISVLLQTLCFSLEDLTKDKLRISLKSGDSHVVIYRPSRKAKILLNSFIIGCREVSNTYSDYVQLDIKK